MEDSPWPIPHSILPAGRPLSPAATATSGLEWRRLWPKPVPTSESGVRTKTRIWKNSPKTLSRESPKGAGESRLTLDPSPFTLPVMPAHIIPAMPWLSMAGTVSFNGNVLAVIFISPQSRRDRRENFSFQLPLRGRQIKNNRPGRPSRLCGEIFICWAYPCFGHAY